MQYVEGVQLPATAHAFVDGGYLRRVGEALGVALPDPRRLVLSIGRTPIVEEWAGGANTSSVLSYVRVAQTTYYDAEPDDASQRNPQLDAYWKHVELLPDTHLGFGVLRGQGRRKARQKGVDTLIAVDMLVGTFNRLFDVAILVGGDADFVPVVSEVRRRGAAIVVAAEPESVADELRRSADRFIRIVRQVDSGARQRDSVGISAIQS